MKLTFEKDLRSCKIGKCEIFVDSIGAIYSVMHGRTNRHGDSARKYVRSRPALRQAYIDWSLWRKATIDDWKHTTLHHRYIADRGTLALRVNGVMVLVGNGYGDGDFPVYVNAGNLPPTFNFTGTSIDGPCDVELMDYDCKGGNVLETIRVEDGRTLCVMREGAHTGAMALTI